MAAGWIILSSFLFMHQASGIIINVALRKPVNVSSRYNDRDPRLAVDGKTIAVDPHDVMHTSQNKSYAWWWVDLQTHVQDATVKIYFRKDYIRRRNGVQLYTSTTPFNTYPSGDLCYTVTGRPNGTDIPDVVSVNCSGTWRYLMVYTDTDNSVEKNQGPILDFGEVEVLVCSNDTYGAICTKSCSSRLCTEPSTSCERFTGACPTGGCKAGWIGADCTQVCMRDMYGTGCNSSCADRNCIGSSSCDHVTGQCDNGCQAGWSGIDCKQVCPPGRYGANCVKSCSARQCKTPSSSCESETGQCPDECKDGWKGQDCVSQCLTGTFGPGCLNCSTRHCRGESDCPGDGICSGGCEDGWTLNNCTQACDREHYGRDCSGECVTRHCEGASTCSPSTGQCDGACQAGWSGADCTELETRSSEEDQTPVVVGTVAAVVVIIIIVVVVIGLMWRRRRLKSKETRGLDHVYYNDVDASVKVKEDASTGIADRSVPVGDYDNKDNQVSVGVANTMSDINGRDEDDPVIDRTYEKIDTLSTDGVYTDLHGHSSYENWKGRDK